MRIALAFVFCTALALSSAAQTFPRQLSEKFLTELPAGAEEAIAGLYFHNPDFADLNADRYERIKADIMSQTEANGEMLGYEFVDEERIGESLVRLTYMAKYQRNPAVVYFTWYKPQDRWIIIDMKFDSKPHAIQQLLNKSK